MISERRQSFLGLDVGRVQSFKLMARTKRPSLERKITPKHLFGGVLYSESEVLSGSGLVQPGSGLT